MNDDTLIKQPLTRKSFLAVGAAGALFLAGCGTKSGSGSSSKPTIKVGDKGFTEEFLIADMYEDMLQAHGYTTSRHSYGSVQLAQSAITHGDIDLYPEYTGTGLLEVLKLPVMQNEQQIYTTVKKDYKQKFNLTWLQPSPMNDTNAVAMTMATKQKYNITTMSDLAKVANQLTFVGLAECVGRPDCLIGLQKTYNMHFKKVITTTSAPLNYKALLDGTADVSEVFSTDGQIAANNLYVPVDDKHLWPPYHVAPVIRDDTLSKNPDIAGILNKLAPHITTHAISSLNAQVDLKQKPHKTVAHQWLKSQGLI